MKLIAVRKDAMVRIKSGGNFMYITSDHPVEVNTADPEVQSQVATMMKLGWIVEVKETNAGGIQNSGAQGKEGQENQKGNKKSQQKNIDEAILVE
jgi:hypothetical protein